MRVLFMGTPDFAVYSLEALCSSRHEVIGVVTQPDRPGNRGVTVFSAVKKYALAKGLPVYQFEKIRKDGVDVLRSLGADVFVTAAYGQILSREIIELPRYGILNVHASLLPAYRGSCPIQRAIINGEKETGVTIMQTAEGLDTGDILYVKKIKISADDNAETLFVKLGELGASALTECLDKLEKGEITPVKQNESEATYYPMLCKADGKTDWSLSAEALDCFIRGVTPWPGAYTYFNGKLLKIHRAVPVEGRGDAGAVIGVDKNGIKVACGRGALLLKEVQLEGKKRMCCADFLNGCKLKTGDRFGDA